MLKKRQKDSSLRPLSPLVTRSPLPHPDWDARCPSWPAQTSLSPAPCDTHPPGTQSVRITITIIIIIIIIIKYKIKFKLKKMLYCALLHKKWTHYALLPKDGMQLPTWLGHSKRLHTQFLSPYGLYRYLYMIVSVWVHILGDSQSVQLRNATTTTTFYTFTQHRMMMMMLYTCIAQSLHATVACSVRSVG